MSLPRTLRTYFDSVLEEVLDELPEDIQRLLDVVPLYVEDYPAPDVLREHGLTDRTELCGLHTGVPLIERHSETPVQLSNAVFLYREGLLTLAAHESGTVDEEELREQIRVTVLHEFGHFHGLTEEDLDELGYG